MDYILNGQAGAGSSSIVQKVLDPNFNVNMLRPWYNPETGLNYITVNQGGKLKSVVTNANTTLRKDDWKILDTAVVKAAKQRLRLVGDLRSAGLTYNIPNGMGKTVLETENQSDINDATISMDGIRKGQADRPQYNLTNLPLPIIHKDFGFSARQIATSRNSGTPLDTTMAELAGRKVAEEVEKLLLGVSASYSYGGGTIYGYTNFTGRITTSVTSPTASGWTPATLVSEVLAMKTLSQQQFHYGPWAVYTGLAWDQYLDDDYSSAKGDNTLRERIASIQGIDGVMTADYLTGFDVLLVQKTADVARMVNGMDISTVQWDTEGGMWSNFKVMTIQVPQLREDYNGNTGIVHATV